MWPKCINNLSPLQGKFSLEIPEFLKTAFNKQGIFNEEEMFMPIRQVNILGICSTALYLDCPNIPDHHLYHAEGHKDDPDYDMGRYFWFDFDIVGMDGEYLPLRMVFNEGDADCNDGFWGVVWERNTEEIIANIISSGDMETTVEVISKKHIDMYESQEIVVPTIFYNTIVANDTKLEKILYLVMQFCYEWIYDEDDTESIYDEDDIE
ncbi:MAG: hypothetical protein WBA93_32915 [Microcoleaceae cyanobacterium]